jgi:hypothetical protein
MFHLFVSQPVSPKLLCSRALEFQSKQTPNSTRCVLQGWKCCCCAAARTPILAQNSLQSLMPEQINGSILPDPPIILYGFILTNESLVAFVLPF